MVTLPATIITNPGNGTAYVGINMGFRQDCGEPTPTLATWDWGDGQVLSGVPANTSWQYHVYRNPGTYTVHVHRYNFYSTPYCGPTYTDEYRTVTILENRLISSTPANPIINQPVTFTATNFNTPADITWIMGDGTTLSHRGNSVTHAYSIAGNYSIRAYDWNGNTTTTPVTMTLNVLADNRLIDADPAHPIAGQTITFTARNFNTPSDITWNMGDGTTLSHRGNSVTHAYSIAGNYAIRAYDWNGNTTTTPVTMTLNVLADNRLIDADPAHPIAGQTITFTARNFNTPTDITWNMDDGTTLTHRGDRVTHAYAKAGDYRISAYDWNGNTATTPVTLTLNILADNRLIAANPAHPNAGQTITFTATNFKTPTNITWDVGDGVTYLNKGSVITHTYSKAGTYSIKAFDWNGDTATIPVTLVLTVTPPPRGITYSPQLPRVDQPVNIQVYGFKSDSIDWNFGDGSPGQTFSASVSHRFQNPGTFTITAREHGMDTTPESKAITILPENRSLTLSVPEARIDEPVTVTAVNFRGPLVLWDFGDSSTASRPNTIASSGNLAGISGPITMTHAYKLPGNYLITARDENGASEKKFQARVKILGISDQVNLEIAEITLDNGKYYKVVPKNSKNIKAQLKMKMKGTGIVSGYWIVDGQPYQFFNETVYQGQIKSIFTQDIPGLPVFDPGMHTITMQLTRPVTESVIFPTLKYFVLPYENIIEILTPRDGSIIKEDEVPGFSWKKVLGGSYYQIAFANSLFPLLQNDSGLKWIDCPDRLQYTPDAETWKSIRRNHWTYWKIRAMDSNKIVLAESDIQDIKVIILGAKVGIEKITDLNGRNIAIGNSVTSTKTDQLLIHGYLTYPDEAEYLILQVYANDNLADQLLFRDVIKDEKMVFETSVPNMEKESRIVFQVLKSSSPSVIIGVLELQLKND